MFTYKTRAPQLLTSCLFTPGTNESLIKGYVHEYRLPRKCLWKYFDVNNHVFHKNVFTVNLIISTIMSEYIHTARAYLPLEVLNAFTCLTFHNIRIQSSITRNKCVLTGINSMPLLKHTPLKAVL